MKMVAAAKLRRAQASAEEGRPYSHSMERMLSGLIASLPTLDTAPKLLSGYGASQKHLLIVVTADRGLCGGYNSNIAREAKRQIAKLHKDGKEVKLFCIGRKGRDALRREYGRLIDDSSTTSPAAGPSLPRRATLPATCATSTRRGSLTSARCCTTPSSRQ